MVSLLSAQHPQNTPLTYVYMLQIWFLACGCYITMDAAAFRYMVSRVCRPQATMEWRTNHSTLSAARARDHFMNRACAHYYYTWRSTTKKFQPYTTSTKRSFDETKCIRARTALMRKLELKTFRFILHFCAANGVVCVIGSV